MFAKDSGVDNDANALMRKFGLDAYHIARLRCYESTGHSAHYWGRVAAEIARRVGSRNPFALLQST